MAASVDMAGRSVQVWSDPSRGHVIYICTIDKTERSENDTAWICFVRSLLCVQCVFFVSTKFRIRYLVYVQVIASNLSSSPLIKNPQVIFLYLLKTF